MVIAFVSLYLGLLTGTQPVELTASSAVASVELRLDGRSVAVMTSPPWRTRIDFGTELRPRRLSAIAKDASGRELGRVEQVVNGVRPAAEASIVLERSADRVTAARLAWQSVAEARPRSVHATLDGRPLAVEDPARIAIPPLADDRFHLLVVDLVFSDQQRVQVTAGFGGAFADSAETELTALPVIAAQRRLDAERLASDTVRRADRPVTILSIEKGPADVVFVRDPVADTIIERLGARDGRSIGGGAVATPGGVIEGGGITRMAAASPAEALRRGLTLDGDIRVRMIWPASQRVVRDEVSMDLLPASPVFSAADGGIFWALTQNVAIDGARQVQRLADAVAVAGLAAAGDNRRRAVVLVLGPEPGDGSRFSPATVKDFLDALGVPLVVWTVSDDRPVPTPAAWHSTHEANIASLGDLRKAVRNLDKYLDRQRIAWIEGRYLIHELTVAEGAAIRSLTP